MKKIFAIALALVMVLSMASAFAWTLDCAAPAFGWACATDPSYCGKGTVDVKGYVKQNADCDSWEYVETECASAIKTEKVYYTIAVTVEENPSPDWWAKAAMEIDYEGLNADDVASKKLKAAIDALEAEFAADDYDDEEHVFYLTTDLAGWVDADDVDLKKSNVMFSAKVLDADEAEVCATLTSAHTGLGTFTWGDYTVKTVQAKDESGNKIEGDNYVITFKHADFSGKSVVLTVVDGKVYSLTSNSDALYALVQADFALNQCSIGTCINADNIQANFGWDDEIKDCYGWDKEGSTAINPDCVVAIPKTGDVSVVAYAVMAVVAAAGTMLKK